MSPAPTPLAPGRRRLTLVAMCIGQGMILLDNTIVNVALPAIQRGLGVTPGALEWTVNAYVLALASLIIVVRFELRRVRQSLEGVVVDAHTATRALHLRRVPP